MPTYRNPREAARALKSWFEEENRLAAREDLQPSPIETPVPNLQPTWDMAQPWGMEPIYSPTADGRVRGRDHSGSGEFGAPRSYGPHRGLDILAAPGDPVLAAMTGEVTKIGMPYKNLPLRHVEITSPNGYVSRTNYVSPSVHEGQHVIGGATQIGAAQDNALIPDYNGANHVHQEFRNPRIISYNKSKNDGVGNSIYLRIDPTHLLKRGQVR